MTQLAALVRAKLRMARHWIASVRHESRLKVAFVSVSAVLLWLVLFLVSAGVLSIFQRFGDEIFGDTGNIAMTDVVLHRILAVFSLAIFSLLILSNLLVAFATLFRAKEMTLLLRAPVPPATLFLGRFIELVTLSSWGLAFLGAPVLLAYGLVRDVSPWFYAAAVAFALPFMVLPAALGSLLALLLTRLLAGRRRRTQVVGGLFAAGAVAVFWRLRAGVTVAEADNVQAIVEAMGRAQSPLLPSHWLSQGLLFSSVSDIGQAAFYWFVLLINALFALFLATLAADRWMVGSYSDLIGSGSRRRRAADRSGPAWRHTAFGFLREPVRSLVDKDLRLFWRDTPQWTQFLFFFGLMALYLSNMRRSGPFFGEEPFRTWIAILNMAATMLILATLTTRFVFPLLSLEGRRFWILGLAPLSRRDLVLQKFWLSLGICLLFTMPLAVISGFRLQLGGFELATTVLGMFAAGLGLSGLAVGLGSLYPNFQEDNPARITSGLGGTLNFMLSLGFLIVLTSGQAFAVNWHKAAELGEQGRTIGVAVVAGLMLLATAMTTWVPLRLGIRHLENADL